MFGKGISKEGDVLDLAASVGIVQKSGAWFAYGGDKIGQGRENAKAYLREHPEIMDARGLRPDQGRSAGRHRGKSSSTGNRRRRRINVCDRDSSSE